MTLSRCRHIPQIYFSVSRAKVLSVSGMVSLAHFLLFLEFRLSRSAQCCSPLTPTVFASDPRLITYTSDGNILRASAPVCTLTAFKSFLSSTDTDSISNKAVISSLKLYGWFYMAFILRCKKTLWKDVEKKLLCCTLICGLCNFCEFHFRILIYCFCAFLNFNLN